MQFSPSILGELRRLRKPIIVSLIAVSVIVTVVVATHTSGQPLPYEFVQVGGIASGVPGEEHLVINDQQTWLSTLTQVFCSGANYCPPAPQIDFANHTVLAVFQGMKPSGGYGLNITQVEDTDSQVVVTVVERVPGALCYVTLGITHPYQIVQIPKTQKPVDFAIITEVRKC